jgi:zinc protease
MAHLIEHTGFNGTTHFKKNELIDYLRSVGVDLNVAIVSRDAGDARPPL